MLMSMYKLAGRLWFSLAVLNLKDSILEPKHFMVENWFGALCRNRFSVALQQQLSFSQSPFTPSVRATTKHGSAAT